MITFIIQLIVTSIIITIAASSADNDRLLQMFCARRPDLQFCNSIINENHSKQPPPIFVAKSNRARRYPSLNFDINRGTSLSLPENIVGTPIGFNANDNTRLSLDDEDRSLSNFDPNQSTYARQSASLNDASSQRPKANAATTNNELFINGDDNAADLIPQSNNPIPDWDDGSSIVGSGGDASPSGLTHVPLKSLGVTPEQLQSLCIKFQPVVLKYCYQDVKEQFRERCNGYFQDCAPFFADSQSQLPPPPAYIDENNTMLGRIANSYSSGVGLTYYNWAVGGIPFYPVNQEGGIGNGYHGKVDYGGWGGGYSENFGVRDYFSQTSEVGANWYDSVYGYKSGWVIPIVQSLGVEGVGATQVSVPLKEGELGKPISVVNGYQVGPYAGYRNQVGVDWLNGGVSAQSGVAVPFAGVGVNYGTSVSFPSMGSFMHSHGSARYYR